MHGIRTSIASLIILLPLAAQDYFPLQAGNVWVYKGSGSRAGSETTVEVTGTAEYNGTSYSILHGLTERDALLREDNSGNVFAYDPAAGQEKPWFAFNAPEGSIYESVVSCCNKAMVAARNAKYTGPVGSFDYALQMTYPGVFQVGVANDLFLPYVGLVSRSIATGGPTYAGLDLIYARLGGVTFLTGPQVSFTLTLDKTTYPTQNADMIARLTLSVKQAEPLSLTFSSGQMFDLVVRNSAGKDVYRWSAGVLFAQIVQTIQVSGEKNWVVHAVLGKAAALPPGQYTAEGYLTPTGDKRYTATVGFEVK